MDYNELTDIIIQTNNYLQKKAISFVSQSLTVRNWLIGHYIVEYEQKGKDKSQYGEHLLGKLSGSLKSRGLKGSSLTNLKLYRKFYLTYPSIGQSLPDQFIPEEIAGTLKDKSPSTPGTKKSKGLPELLINKLSFTHIVELIKEEEPLKRAFYEIEAIKGNWSVRELKRQRESLLFERTGLSKDKEKLLKTVKDTSVELSPKDIIRDPYVFEFLGLKQQEVLEEFKLEQILLDHLQEFLLESGKGFCFEARQKRISLDNEDYSIDLLFYHRVLKCHVIIDLKIRKFRHEDAGKMNFYLNYIKPKLSDFRSLPAPCTKCRGQTNCKVFTFTYSVKTNNF